MSWALWLILFYTLQIVANLFFKYGSVAPERFWIGFSLGNLFGVVSILVLMRLYQGMQVNLANAIAGGGTFVLVQVSLLLVFRERLTWLQCAGILALAVGMFLVAWGKDELRV